MMRRGCTDASFIKDDEDNVIGINLGYDFTAEHEFGIKGLMEDFRLKFKDKLGFEARKNTRVPSQLIYRENGSNILVYAPRLYSDESLERLLKGELSLRGDDELATAWDENSFGVNVVPAYQGTLKSLYEAFKSKKGIIMLSGRNNHFANSGLILADYRKIPKETKDEFREKDRQYREEQAMFRKMEEESGVYDLLKEADKKYFALSVKHLDKNGQAMWWLNPYKRDIYEAGWYTTEQLRQWAKDEGPVVKKSD